MIHIRHRHQPGLSAAYLNGNGRQPDHSHLFQFLFRRSAFFIIFSHDTILYPRFNIHISASERDEDKKVGRRHRNWRGAGCLFRLIVIKGCLMICWNFSSIFFVYLFATPLGPRSPDRMRTPQSWWSEWFDQAREGRDGYAEGKGALELLTSLSIP